jgi:hypothetical protein
MLSLGKFTKMNVEFQNFLLGLDLNGVGGQGDAGDGESGEGVE